MSDSEGGDPPIPFKPWNSLLRTPLRRMMVSPSDEVLRTPPFAPAAPSQSAIEAANSSTQAVYAAVMQVHSLGTSPQPSVNTPMTPRQKPSFSGPAGSEEEDCPCPEGRHRGNTLRVEASTRGTEYGTPFETSTDDDAKVADGQLHRASGRQLVARAAAASRSIVSVAGTSSKLNNSDVACINGDLARMPEIFSHLGMMAEHQRVEIVTLRTTVTEREDAWRRDRGRAVEAEAEAAAARSEASMAATKVVKAATTAMAATGATMMPTTTTSYADKLRAKALTGPILAIYPVEGSTVKTSEELKTVVKSSVAPAKLQININKGNSPSS
ncbi:hypothetical protein ACJJTC_016421 [Scirpophaga incertulas]